MSSSPGDLFCRDLVLDDDDRDGQCICISVSSVVDSFYIGLHIVIYTDEILSGCSHLMDNKPFLHLQKLTW